jgi:nuclease HARBI1
VAFNGHKTVHALKYQGLILPDGMIGSLFGPIEGRHNDAHLLNASNLMELCAEFAACPGTNEDTPIEDCFFQMFGHSAYGVGHHIQSPFSGPGDRTAEEQEWNSQMAALRIEVEHAFGIVAKTWPFLNAGWKMQVNSSPVGLYYCVAVLLTNALNCMQPNQISQFFKCHPPTLAEYFHD